MTYAQPSTPESLNPTKKHQMQAGWSLIMLMGIGVTAGLAILLLARGIPAQELGIGALFLSIMGGIFIWPGAHQVKEVSLSMTLGVGVVLGAVLGLMYHPPQPSDSMWTMFSLYTLIQFALSAYLTRDREGEPQEGFLAIPHETLVWGFSIAMTVSYGFGAYEALCHLAWMSVLTLLVGYWARSYVSHSELLAIKRSESSR